SPSATSPALTPLDNTSPTDANPGFLWRTVPPDSLQSTVIVQDMVTRRMTPRVAVVYQTGAYGEALSQLFVAEYMRAGGTVTATPFTSGALADVISSVGAGDSQEVLFISSSLADSIGFLNAATSTPALQA